MTKHEIEILNVMCSRGKTATDIALALQVSVNTVRSYIRRHPPEDAIRIGCRRCGKPILQVKGRKAKCFCSDQCRNAWWNAHPEQVRRKAYYRLTCEYCGKEFVNYGNRNRKYCSRICYADARRTRVRYRILCAMLDHLGRTGELDAQTREQANAVLAMKAGLKRDSIFL